MVTADLASPDRVDEATDAAAAGPENVVRAHIFAALVFLALAVFTNLDAAIQLVEPRFLGGTSFLSFGRISPAAANTFIYGWLTIGFIGAAYFIAPRIGGRSFSADDTVRRLIEPLEASDAERRRLASEAGIEVRPSPVVALASRAGGTIVPMAGLGLLVLGVLAGYVEVLAGLREGRRWVEFPIWIDVVLLIGFVIAAQSVTSSISHGAQGRLRPVHWFLVASMWWLVLAHVVGNIPGIAGINAEVQSSFFQASIVGLWFVAIGVAVVGYLLPALAGDQPTKGTRLSELGFWSLAFLWAMTGARAVAYGPIPDWLETLAAFFSIALLVPVAILFADLVYSMRGRWDRVADRMSLRFAMAGSVMLAVLAVMNLVMALRAPSAVVQYTEWVAAYEHLAFYGAFTMWLAAIVYHAIGEIRSSRPSPRLVAVHYWLSLTGILVAVGAMLFGGLQQGLSWASGANSNAFASVGDAFASIARPLEGVYVVRAVGIGLFAVAQLAFIGAVFMRGAPGAYRPATETEEEDVPLPEEILETRELTLPRLRFGAAGLFVVAALFTWVLPSFEGSHSEPTLRADRDRIYEDDSSVALGRAIYVREGCMYCHTQSVRPIVTDVGLGAVSQPGDYVYETPPVLGVQRIGPDLMHVGARNAAGEPVEGGAAQIERRSSLFTYLINPRLSRPWSTMPSYAHLSDEELTHLADYLAALR
jgi:cbb3-type cytochrome oxidase subunit 1/cbb3-type cytochrome oxidase cytochrome c subunit